MEKLLTIAIPTYNRANYLDLCLENICKETNKYSNIVEIIVSDNCSDDNTSEVVEKYIKSGNKIIYIKNEKNIGMDRNFLQCLEKSIAKYFLMIGDDDVLLPGSLDKIFNYISDDDYGVVYLNSYPFYEKYDVIQKNRKSANNNYAKIYTNKNYFIDDINYMMTFISGNIVNKKYIDNNINYDKLIKSEIIQFYWYMSAIMNAGKNIYIKDYCIAAKSENTGGYSICNVFCANLFNALDYFGEKGLSHNVVNRFKKKMLCDFLPIFIIKHKKSSGSFSEDDYFKLLYPINKNNIVFWLVTVPIIKLPLPFAKLWKKIANNLIKNYEKIFVKKKILFDEDKGFYISDQSTRDAK